MLVGFCFFLTAPVHLLQTGAATLDGYFLMMVAGLAGVSSHMVSASILALARCIYEFHNELSPESQHQLVDAGLVCGYARVTGEIEAKILRLSPH